MAQTQQRQREPTKQGKHGRPAPNRPWRSSLAWSFVTIAALLILAVGVNLVIGRVIHWNIVSGLGALGFVFLSIGRRYRTI